MVSPGPAGIKRVVSDAFLTHPDLRSSLNAVEPTTFHMDVIKMAHAICAPSRSGPASPYLLQMGLRQSDDQPLV
jgi:hypothetical protein